MARKFLLIFAALLLCAPEAFAQIAARTNNGSVTIVTGNTFQTVLNAPSGPLHSLTIENNNAADSCWVHVDPSTATKANSILLLPGGSYSRYTPYVPGDAISATCTNTGDTLYVDTQ